MNQSTNSSTMIIFADAATSPQTGVAVGAFLCFGKEYISEYAECSIERLSAKLATEIVYIELKSKKSTWSEIRTVIDALNFARRNTVSGCTIQIYTDCQSLCDLLGKRKEKLKSSNYTTRTGKLLNNATLYQELFEVADKVTIQTCKIKGHRLISQRTTWQDRIFSLLDKFSRKKLRWLLNHE